MTMSDARQHQKPSEFRQPARTERGAHAQRLGDLPEYEKRPNTPPN